MSRLAKPWELQILGVLNSMHLAMGNGLRHKFGYSERAMLALRPSIPYTLYPSRISGSTQLVWCNRDDMPIGTLPRGSVNHEDYPAHEIAPDDPALKAFQNLTVESNIPQGGHLFVGGDAPWNGIKHAIRAAAILEMVVDAGGGRLSLGFYDSVRELHWELEEWKQTTGRPRLACRKKLAA